MDLSRPHVKIDINLLFNFSKDYYNIHLLYISFYEKNDTIVVRSHMK